MSIMGQVSSGTSRRLSSVLMVPKSNSALWAMKGWSSRKFRRSWWMSWKLGAGFRSALVIPVSL